MDVIKKYVIRIPQNIIVYYSEKKKMLTVQGPCGIKSLILPVKIFISEFEKGIKVTRLPFSGLPNNIKKQLKILQGLTLSIIKQYILDVSLVRFKKLKLVGVGYKIFNVEVGNSSLIYFKLGYSHFVYFKLPSLFKLIIIKSIKLFILGHSYQIINQIAAYIRNFRVPEPYKGKGVLYENESIKLKKGKKI